MSAFAALVPGACANFAGPLVRRRCRSTGKRVLLSALAVGLALILGRQAAAQDMPLSQILVEGQSGIKGGIAGWELVSDGHQFTEGPAADPQGNLYFSDVRASRIHRVDANTGEVTLFAEDTQRTNGLMFGPDGRLYGVQAGAQRIVVFDGQGRTETVAEGIAGNDLVVTRQGGIYVTEPSQHRVWYVSPQGEKRVAAEGIERPNGLILWPDEGTLVVADTAGSRLWTYRVESDGSLSFGDGYYGPLRLVAGQSGSGADGLTVDVAGRVYVATHAGLQIFDPTGRMSGVLAKPHAGRLTNVTFAGPNFDVLYVTAGDKVFRRPTKTAGVNRRRLQE